MRLKKYWRTLPRPSSKDERKRIEKEADLLREEMPSQTGPEGGVRTGVAEGVF